MTKRAKRASYALLVAILLPLAALAVQLPGEPLGGHSARARRAYPPVANKPKPPASNPASQEAASTPTSAPANQGLIDDFADALGDSASAPSTQSVGEDDFANALAASEPSAPITNPDLEDAGGALVEPGGAFSEAIAESKDSFFSWKSYEIWRDPITVNAFAALICGFLGVYVILRRMVFVSATISQISSVGVVLGFYLSILFGIARSEQGEGNDAAAGLLGFVTDPLWLAVAFSLAGAAFFALNTDRKRMSQESLIGIGYSVAAGLVMAILNSKTMTAEAHAVEAILFGDAAVVDPRELYIVSIVAVLVLAFHLYFFRAFLFSSLDPTTAKTLGIDPKFFSVLLLMSLGLVISVTTRAIGALPVFGYLVIPPAAAILLSDHLKTIFLLGPLFGVFSAVVGYYLSWVLEMPTPATVVITAALTLIPGLIKRGLERWRKPT